MEALIALVALTVMEIVLGIDNIVFIAILSGRLPGDQQSKARRLGLGAALVVRVLLLLCLTWIMKLVDPIFTLTALGIPEAWFPDNDESFAAVNGVSWRDLILLGGGLFLIGKAVHEIHNKLEGAHDGHAVKDKVSLTSVLIQIAILDIVFSLDSVITAVGMAEELWVMILAVIIAMCVMLIFAGKVSEFIHKHPTLKMLGLSFLLLIGVMLVAEGIGGHIEKGYIYFAMAFALLVEFLNLKVKIKSEARTAADA
jgi:predicted tellurium resistance membrane protein TerC